MNRFDGDDAIATSLGEVAIHGVRTDVPLKLGAGAAGRAAAATERVYLGLEGVRGTADASVLGVYLRLPGPSPAKRREFRAGSLALYGLRRASASPGEGPGRGLRFVLDVTPFFSRLGASAGNEVMVSIRLRRELPAGADVVIERIVLFRRDDTVRPSG